VVCITKVNWYCPTSDDIIIFLGRCFVKLNNTFAYIICKFNGEWDQCHEYWLTSQVQLLRLVVFDLYNFILF
jgi:hypothetical protein